MYKMGVSLEFFYFIAMDDQRQSLDALLQLNQDFSVPEQLVGNISIAGFYVKGLLKCTSSSCVSLIV